VATEAALATLEKLWTVLEPLGHPLAVMGGISLAAWGHLRATRDLDLLIAVDAEALNDVLRALGQRGFHPKRLPPIIVVGDHKFVQFLYTPPEEFFELQFDLLLAETELQKSAIARRVRGEVPGIKAPVFVLSCEDLILFKVQADRMIDRADAAMLLRENRDEIDFAYLRQWIEALKLDAEYAEIWREAFPGETLPA
jgi:hypothetical protein